jgi:hypothetical protein
MASIVVLFRAAGITALDEADYFRISVNRD